MFFSPRRAIGRPLRCRAVQLGALGLRFLNEALGACLSASWWVRVPMATTGVVAMVKQRCCIAPVVPGPLGVASTVHTAG